jgi:flagellar motility protein MotE (MotC chaperone)
MMATKEIRPNRPVLLQKLLWALLVIVVPIIAAAAMIGVALQVLGVPVWQTTMQYVGLAPKTALTQTPLDTAQNRLTDANTKVASLTDQQQKLQAQLADAQAQAKSLQDQVAQLQGQVQGHSDADAQAKTEASVLAGMDPNQAAGVLSKMSIDEASTVVANMSATDSANILAAMDAGTAARILSLAAQKQQANASASTTASDNSASNQTGH